MSIQDFINKETDTTKKTRSVSILKRVVMETDLSYKETLQVPENMSDEEVRDLIADEVRQLDGGLFTECGDGAWCHGELSITDSNEVA